jgi:hypothetical protein
MKIGYYFGLAFKYAAVVSLVYMAVDVAGTSAERWLCALMSLFMLAATVKFGDCCDDD